MKHFKSRLIPATVLLFSYIALAGCGGSSDSAATGDKDTKTADQQEKTVVLYNYEEYIGSETVRKFEKKTGITVEEFFFSDEEEALGSLQSDSDRYDLMVISGDTVREMILAKTLAPLDHGLIPNMANIGHEFVVNYYDNGLMYSAPYLWGTTGIVVNRDYVLEGKSWGILWQERYKGKVAMLNNPFEVLAAGLLMAGHSINADGQEELAAARDLLMRQRPILAGYYDDMDIQDLMAAEEIWAAQIYNGEGMILMDEDKKFEYFVPDEGAARWVDCLIIPRGAEHVAEAHEFINFILEPEINAAIATELWYATANVKAIPLMDEEVRESPMVYPPPEVLARCEYFDAFGEPTAYASRLWADLTLGE